ncbi:MAG: DUF4251 domain-containing protein [Draconibacterium sp.]
MKHIILIVLILGASFATQAQDKKMSKKEKKAKIEAEKKEKTKKLISDKTWRFDADRMLPTTGPSKTLVTDYGVDFLSDKIESYLPFMGRAYKADYGSTNSPMDFKSEVEDYKIEDWEKGGWLIQFSVKNKSDFMQFTYTISATGSASLSVSSSDRQNISYQGEITEVKKKKE